MEAKIKRRLIRGAVVASLLIGVGTVGALKWQDGLRALIYQRPIRYDVPFGPAIEGADRIVVRAGGFDCCGPVDETKIMFVVTKVDEIKDVQDHLRFVPRTTTNSFWETCMCCGCPGIDWYRGEKRVALTSIQHGHAIRWRGFSTARILGFRIGYGDGPLTTESEAWLKEWIKTHGIGKEEEASANKAMEATSEAAQGAASSARED